MRLAAESKQAKEKAQAEKEAAEDKEWEEVFLQYEASMKTSGNTWSCAVHVIFSAPLERDNTSHIL
jgi:hypothetical protein